MKLFGWKMFTLVNSVYSLEGAKPLYDHRCKSMVCIMNVKKPFQYQNNLPERAQTFSDD